MLTTKNQWKGSIGEEITNLHNTIRDLQIKLLDAMSENGKLKQEIQKLKELTNASHE